MSIKKSFSLIEVLIFVTILAMFLIAAASIITVSMRQNKVKINMLRAIHYNEQLLEWITGEKEMDWNLFVAKGIVTGTTYCFPLEDLSSPWPFVVVGDPKTVCTSDLGGMYRRYATVTTIGAPVSRVDAVAHTEWEEAGNIYKTELNTVFTLWE